MLWKFWNKFIEAGWQLRLMQLRALAEDLYAI